MREGLLGKSYFCMICILMLNIKENGMIKFGYEYEGYIMFNIG